MVRKSLFRSKLITDESYDYSDASTEVPEVTQHAGASAHLKQLLVQTWFYFKMVMKELPFQGILLAGLMITTEFFFS